MTIEDTFSANFKLTLVEAYLNGEARCKVIAARNGIPNALLVRWVWQYHVGELSHKERESDPADAYRSRIAALELTIDKLTNQLDSARQAEIGPGHRTSPPGGRPFLTQANGAGLRTGAELAS